MSKEVDMMEFFRSRPGIFKMFADKSAVGVDGKKPKKTTPVVKKFLTKPHSKKRFQENIRKMGMK